jgi:hypothetical protein
MGNTTDVPYKFVNAGTHCNNKKKERERASNALGETNNLPRIQLPGNTKQELRIDRRHKCQKSQKGSIPERMSPESKDPDFNTR